MAKSFKNVRHYMPEQQAQAVFSFLAGIGCGAVVIDFLVFIEDR